MSSGFLRQQYFTPSSSIAFIAYHYYDTPLVSSTTSLSIPFHTHHYDLPNFPSTRITSLRHLRHDLFLFMAPLPYALPSTTTTFITRYSHLLRTRMLHQSTKSVSSFSLKGLVAIVYCVPLYLHLHQPTASCLSRKLSRFIRFVIGFVVYLGWLELLGVCR